MSKFMRLDLNLRKNLLVLFLYSLVAGFFTYPLIFHLRTHIYGYPGDSFGTVWRLWWQKLAMANGLDPHFSPITFYPVGYYLDSGAHPAAFIAPLQFLTYLFGEVAAVNVWILISLTLSAFGSFLLVKKMTGDERAGLTSGLVFGFCQYQLWQGMQHLDLIAVFWLPLFFYHLWRFTEAKSIRAGIILAASSSLVFLTSFQIGYLALLFLVCFWLLEWFYDWSHGVKILDRARVRSYLVFTAACLIFTLPGTYSLGRARWGNASRYEHPRQENSATNRRSEELFGMGFAKKFTREYYAQESLRHAWSRNTLDDLFTFAARPWDYFLPSIYHPVFGGWVQKFYSTVHPQLNRNLRSASVPERCVFLGWTALVLAFLGYRWGRRDPRLKKVVWLVGCSTLFLVWASFPPYLWTKLGKVPISPSHLLFKFFPMFRVYARAGILVQLCLAVLGGIGLSFLVRRIKSPRIVGFCLGLVVVLVLFENLNSPPFHTTDVSQVPEVYRWLREQPRGTLVVEFPVGPVADNQCYLIDPSRSCDYLQKYSILYQRIHQQPVLGTWAMSDSQRSVLSDWADPGTVDLLQDFGVNIVIIHTGDHLPVPNPFDPFQGRRVMVPPTPTPEGLVPVEEFEAAVVYRVLHD